MVPSIWLELGKVNNMINARNVNIEAGQSYKINGRKMKVSAILPVDHPASKYLRQRAMVKGVRGAEYCLEVRHSGTAFWFGIRANLVEEISLFESMKG